MKKALYLSTFFSVLLFAGCSEFKEVQVSQISGVKILKLTNKGVDLEIGMKIHNPNNYSFTIYPSTFDIHLSGTDLGQAKLQKKEKVGPNSDEVHTFQISTTFDKLMEGGIAGVLTLFGSKHTDLEIKGKLKAGRFLFRKRIPIDRKQKVGLDNQSGGSLLDLFKK